MEAFQTRNCHIARDHNYFYDTTWETAAERLAFKGNTTFLFKTSSNIPQGKLTWLIIVIQFWVEQHEQRQIDDFVPILKHISYLELLLC